MSDRERRLEPTISPKSFRIIMGFAIDQEIGKHTAASRLIQKGIECLPENIQQKYLNMYDEKLAEDKASKEKIK